MAIELTQTATVAGFTDWLRVDSTGHAGYNFLLVVDMEDNTNATVSVEFTVDKDLTNPRAIEHHIMKDLTKSLASTLQVPATGFRLNVKGYSKGTVTFKLLQHQD
jgi:hypothetical protein